MKLRSASNWAELHALEGFVHEQQPIANMLAGAVVGQYEMTPTTDLRRCGIDNCSRAHRHGFIVELSDGRISNVGRDCGRSKLGARWNQMLKRFRTARKEHAAQEARENIRAEALDLLSSVQELPDGLNLVREQLVALNTLPRAIREELLRRTQRAGDEHIVQVREPTREEVARAKFHGKRIPTRTEHVVATIRSIKAIAPNSRADTVADLRLPKRIRELKDALADDSVTNDQLKEKMRLLKETRELLDRGIARAADFFTGDNIGLLRHLDSTGSVKRVILDQGPPIRIKIVS